jgi:transcriptional regulator with XRE-family HTH domain
LEIIQIKAARRLGIDHSVLSKYELGKLGIPLDISPAFRKVYAIPKDKFVDMLEDTRNKRKHPDTEAKENRKRFATDFQNEYIPYIVDSKEFRYLNSLDEKTVKNFIMKDK